MSEYDAFAEHFSQTRQRAWPEFEKYIFPHLKKGDRILDLGCGNGRLRSFLDNQVTLAGDYYGFDISQELLAIARKQNPKDHFFHGDMKKLPFGNDNFNFVGAIASFHHLLNRKDQLECLSEIYRVLKPGGLVLVTNWKLPQKHFWPNILRGNFKNWNIPFGKEKHPRTYRRVTLSEMKSLLKRTGFEVKTNELFENRNYVAIAQKK